MEPKLYMFYVRDRKGHQGWDVVAKTKEDALKYVEGWLDKNWTDKEYVKDVARRITSSEPIEFKEGVINFDCE